MFLKYSSWRYTHVHATPLRRGLITVHVNMTRFLSNILHDLENMGNVPYIVFPYWLTRQY